MAAIERPTYTHEQQNRLTASMNAYLELTTIADDALDRESRKILGSGMSVSDLYEAAGRETLLSNFLAAGVQALEVEVGSRTGCGVEEA